MVQIEVASFVKSSSLSLVLLIVRIAIKAVNELFCTMQCILVRLCSPEQELKDEQLFEERLEYTHVHSCSGKGECGFFIPWVETSPGMWYEVACCDVYLHV